MQNALEDAYQRENEARFDKAFRRGLAMVRANSKKATKNLKDYVKAYYKQRTLIRKKEEDHSRLKAHIRAINKDVDAYVNHLKNHKKYKNAPNLPNHIKFNAVPPVAPDTRKHTRFLQFYKRRIAGEAGYKPVETPGNYDP